MKSSNDLIEDILRECRFLEGSARGISLESFLGDELRKRAFARSIEIIGEAVKGLPETLVTKYPSIPWRKMASMRDRLIHAYFAVDYSLVFEVASIKVPDLLEGLQTINPSDLS